MGTYNIEEVPVLILAGGRGTRLQSEVSDRAKPMADINGEPFLDLLLERYKNHKIYISVGYMKETIVDYYKNKYEYIIEDKPLGTGGAIKKAFGEIDSEYLIILNGDTFTDLDLIEAKPDTKVVLNGVYQKNCSRYGSITFDSDTMKIGFTEKSYSGAGYINSGVYIVHKSAVEGQPEQYSFEDYLNKEEDLGLVLHNKKFIDIGVPEDYFKAIKEFG